MHRLPSLRVVSCRVLDDLWLSELWASLGQPPDNPDGPDSDEAADGHGNEPFDDDCPVCRMIASQGGWQPTDLGDSAPHGDHGDVRVYRRGDAYHIVGGLPGRSPPPARSRPAN